MSSEDPTSTMSVLTDSLPASTAPHTLSHPEQVSSRLPPLRLSQRQGAEDVSRPAPIEPRELPPYDMTHYRSGQPFHTRPSTSVTTPTNTELEWRQHGIIPAEQGATHERSQENPVQYGPYKKPFSSWKTEDPPYRSGEAPSTGSSRVKAEVGRYPRALISHIRTTTTGQPSTQA